MSIESIASLKGLGGGRHSMSRGSSVDRSQPPAQQQDGGLLQDTARELEQLFDEFQAPTKLTAFSLPCSCPQSLRNAISTDGDIPSPPRAMPPSGESNTKFEGTEGGSESGG